MDDLDKYKLATQKLLFLIGLWLKEDCGCTCSQCKELLEEAEELLKKDG